MLLVGVVIPAPRKTHLRRQAGTLENSSAAYTRLHFLLSAEPHAETCSMSVLLAGPSQIGCSPNWQPQHPHCRIRGIRNPSTGDESRRPDSLDVCIVTRIVARNQVSKLDVESGAGRWRGHGRDTTEYISPHLSLVHVEQGLMSGRCMHGHVE